MDKEGQSATASASATANGAPEDEKGEFQTKLEGLPQKYKEEILKQVLPLNLQGYLKARTN